MASFSKRSLQDYEAGVTIPYKHMRELSRLLGREVEWFLRGEDPVSDDRLAVLEAKMTTALEELTAAVEDLSGRVEQLSGQAKRPAGHRN
jgi:GH25 family lysozyme M1 (1,4-beta-N-acetylmuramidase)